MREPTKAAHGPEELRRPAARPRNPFIQVAPGPESGDVRDKAGAQRGMAIALIGGGLFWAALGAAAVYFLRR